ncbi:MAG: helix-turn-helix transcriptional regulator [Candidatus Ventricola sp.]|nr:helix-turn-helix transcriptional regulator [Candidatus Ventricola sp.]MDY3832533.1 helix-turn-helix transcriptional regulator [Candidatus Ventricola sp.]
MEFHLKLQELRKRRNLTQEELAQALYVSRTAISKWESGRGYPNIESLKAISKFFSISVDELLSGGELLTLAEEEQREREKRFRERINGMLDCAMALLLFLPFFGQPAQGRIEAVPLLALEGGMLYTRIPSLALVCGTVLWGVLTLVLQNRQGTFLPRWKNRVSLGLSVANVFQFIATQQPYAAAYSFALLLMKAYGLLKRA